MEITYLDMPNSCIKWYELTGTDYGTAIEFVERVFGVTADNEIIDCDGYPLVDGDRETIAVRNSLLAIQ